MIHSVAPDYFIRQSIAPHFWPGDVILTGTPAGVGPIQAGDELEAEIDDWPRFAQHGRDLRKRFRTDSR